MPIHLRAEPGDYAAAVLCPGDPRRAEHIARTFFTDARLVNEERGMLGYTGTFEGRPISVQASGMGCPSAAIVYEELVQLGATPHHPGRHVRRPAAPHGHGRPRGGHGGHAVGPDRADLHGRRAPRARWPTGAWCTWPCSWPRSGARTVHVGGIVSSDVFYDPDPDRPRRWARARQPRHRDGGGRPLHDRRAAGRGHPRRAHRVGHAVRRRSAVRISDAELRQGVERMTELAARVAIADL